MLKSTQKGGHKPDMSSLMNRVVEAYKYFEDRKPEDRKNAIYSPHILFKYPELDNKIDKKRITRIMSFRFRGDERDCQIIDMIERTVTALKAS